MRINLTGIKKINKSSISEEVFEQIRTNIARKRWLPGTKLPSENDLADMFGVSRVSVRAALQRLSALGILESKSGDGTYIREFSAASYLSSSLTPMLVLEPKDIIEILEFRKGLEMQSCVLAAHRGTDEEFDQLSEHLNKMIEDCRTGNRKMYPIHDFEFHLCIAKISKNRLIEQVLRMFKDMLFAHFDKMVRDLGMELNLEHHRMIFESIRMRKSKDAAACMERSLERSIEKLRQIKDA